MYVLTPDEKKRMNKLDFNLGGGYCDFLTGVSKQDPSDDKFLFIGLGGKGCSTVARLKTEVYKQIKCPQGKLKPDSFEYLAIDTDRNALEQLCRSGLGEVGLSNDPDNQEIFEIYDQTLAALLAEPSRRPANIASWMNPNLSPTLVGDGAGGIRQAGRGLLFGGRIGDLWNSIQNKLTNLHDLIIGNQTLSVYVFAGIGGGTGSGMIIDIPYIVREVAKIAGWNVRVFGYIFLPDTYNVSRVTAPHIEKNSYAALQEIDSLMNIGMTGNLGEFKAVYDPYHCVNSTENIFKSCILVSGKRGIGQGLVKDPDQFSKRVVIDNVISQITATRDNNGQMISGSFLDNQRVAVRIAVDNLVGVPKNAYFQYLGIGIGAVELPLDQMMAYVAKGAVNKIDAGLSNHATDQDVKTFLNNLNMLPDEIGGEILRKSDVPLFQYTKAMKQGVTRDMIKDHRWFKIIQGLWMEHNAEMYTQWNIMRQACTSIIGERMAREFQQKFISPDCGIRFLNELLSYKRIDDNDKNKINGVLERIKSDYYSGLQGLINGARAQQKKALDDMQQMESATYWTFPKDMFPYDEYGKACVNSLIWQDIENLYEEWVRKCLDEAVIDLEGKIGEIQKYLSIFNYLKQIVDGNYKTAMGGQMPSHAEYASQLLDFSQKNNDPNVQAVVDYLDGMLAQKTNAGLVSIFETKLWDSKQRWIDSIEKFNPVQVFVDFLEQEFTPIVNLSLDQFMTMKYRTGNMSQAIQRMCDGLKSNANVLFPSIAQLSLNNLPSNNWLIVPAGGSAISQGVIAYAGTVANTKIANSTDRNRIYWYNLTAGIPLFALPEIHSYEVAYKKNLKKDPGIHLFETVEDNWKDFPLLDNQSLWSNGYADPSEIAYGQCIQKDTDLFLKTGLIQSYEEPGTGQIAGYNAYILDDVMLEQGKDAILDWCRNTYIKASTQNEKIDTQQGFVNALGAFCAEKNHEMREIGLQNNSMQFAIDNASSLYKAMRMQRFLYKKLCRTFELYQECKEEIDRHNEVFEKNREKQKNTDRFVSFLKAGIIQMEDKLAYYEDSTGKQNVFIKYFSLNALKKEFCEYYTFERFCEVDGEVLKELDDVYQKFLKKAEQDDEVEEAFEAVGGKFKVKAENAVKQLNQYTTQEDFAAIGEADMPDTLINFYNCMKLYC